MKSLSFGLVIFILNSLWHISPNWRVCLVVNKAEKKIQWIFYLKEPKKLINK